MSGGGVACPYQTPEPASPPSCSLPLYIADVSASKIVTRYLLEAFCAPACFATGILCIFAPACCLFPYAIISSVIIDHVNLTLVEQIPLVDQ